MVNKTAVGLLGVVVVASLGVGILIGMQLGGTTDAPATATPPADDATTTPADEPTETDSPNGTATPVENATERQTPIPARQFAEKDIASFVAKFVNEERRDRNRSAFVTGDATATRVSKMASNHSVAMADYGSLAHEIDGVTTSKRYKNNGLYDRCKFKSHVGSYISTPDEEFETLGVTYAGTEYRDGGETRFNADERAVARTIVDGWMNSSEDSEQLLLAGPTRMGVGVEVTSNGRAYATVAVCA